MNRKHPSNPLERDRKAAWAALRSMDVAAALLGALCVWLLAIIL